MSGLPTLLGRCACGRVAYSAKAVEQEAAVCYCALCRRSSGGAAMAWLNADRATLQISGVVHTWRSTDHAVRQCCPACGSQLFCLEDGEPQIVEVAVGTLDDQQVVKGTRRAFAEQRPAWDASTAVADQPDNGRSDE